MRYKFLFHPFSLLAVALAAGLLTLYFSIRFPPSLPFFGSSFVMSIRSGLDPANALHSLEISFPRGDNPSVYFKLPAVIGILLLSGAVLYAQSGFKEIRLIRFCYSIILGIKAIHVATYGLIIGTGLLVKNFGTDYLLSLGLDMLLSSCWVWYTYRALKIWAQERTLRTIEIETDGALQPVLESAEKKQRVAHFLVDTVLIASVTAPPLAHLVVALAGYGTSGRLMIAAAATLLYYGFYETLFQASPAKMLTQTQVTDAAGDPAPLTTILKRSFCRLIPLEGLSFLNRSGNGIHDAWSDTYVVKEEKFK